jgi:outer membrane protein assembly factor BamB
MRRIGTRAIVWSITLLLTAATAALAKKPVPVNTAPPTVSGTPAQGQTLSGTTGTWTNSPTSYAYQWQRCASGGASCGNVSGATSPSYVVSATDVGSSIRLVVTASNQGGSASAASAATAVVVPLPPANTAPPTVSGTPVERSQLTASTGTWTNSPTAFAYQWQRCDSSGGSCGAISGATTSTYSPGPADWGSALRVAVTASNAGGASAPATSAPTTPVTAPPGTAATAYQLNAGHTGAVGDGFWTGALRRWSVNLGAAISYPLIVGNEVYVTAGDNNSAGSRLYAINATTGTLDWGPVEVGAGSPWSGLAYDGGRVFTVNEHGTMEAFNAATGALAWTVQLPGQYMFSSPPTATAGVVYTGGAGSGGTLYAVDESTGAVLWTSSVMNGDNSSPAVSSSGVYVSYACGQTYDFAPGSGALQWHVNTSCEGGGGKTPVLANGRLYVRDFSYPGVFDAATGALLGTFAASGPAPAVTASTVYDLQAGRLSASGTAPGSATSWTFSGDGTLSSAPLVAGGDVFVAGTSGNIYALDGASGAVLWSANAGAAVAAPDEQNLSQPLTGLAASGGLLVVPAGTTLVAFR